MEDSVVSVSSPVSCLQTDIKLQSLPRQPRRPGSPAAGLAVIDTGRVR